MNVNRIARSQSASANGQDFLTVGPVEICDPVIVDYLGRFDAERHAEQLLHAGHLGVLAIASASPTLDTRIVEAKFAELAEQLREHLSELEEELAAYLKEGDGVLPKTLEQFFNSKGKVAGLLAQHVGPSSTFAKALDPDNKKGVITRIERRVCALIDTRIKNILDQFSLDGEGTAMSRLKNILERGLGDLKKAVGEIHGRQQEAERGHIKGNDFQSDLYERLAGWCAEMDDTSDFVHATPGADGKCKLGDHLITLGDNSAAPGEKVVVEVKDRPSAPIKLRDAVAELQAAKQNRGAAVGVFVFSKGAEPPELRGDFLRNGDDFFCTVDKDELHAGEHLLCFQYAYKIARGMVVAKSRARESGVDISAVVEELDAMAKGVKSISAFITQARTVENNGRKMREGLEELKREMDRRFEAILPKLGTNRK